MPRMLPIKPDPDSPPSEKKVFDALKRGLPDDWTCIHSRRFVHAQGLDAATEGEVDFIVLHPRRGYICLEVKGGRIGREEDKGWYSIDRDDEKHWIKDPGVQVQNACRNISDYLGERIPGPPLRYSWGVVFPDISVEDNLGPALPREIMFDRKDLRNIKAAIERLLDYRNERPREIPTRVKEAFVEELAPTFSLIPLLKDKIDEEHQQLVRLTREQEKVLDVCQAMNRVAVAGGAGTGKTILAMEKAKRLAKEGKRVRFLCFNKPLADDLNSKASGFEATTFHELCNQLASKAGLGFNVPRDREESEKFWAQEAPNLVMKALKSHPEERFDALIIDEGQDFKEDWWFAIEDLLSKDDKEADTEAGGLYVFYDPNQDIYDALKEDLPSALNLAPIVLTINCRNTQRIAEYCSSVIDDQDATTMADAPRGSAVEEARVTNENEMVETVRKFLDRYINNENISPRDIVILTGRGLKRSPVYKAGRLGNFELVRLEDRDKPNAVRIETLYRFKGLEADIAIVCDIDRSEDHYKKEKLYVAASRAQHVLAVVEYAVAEDAAATPQDEAAVA